MPVLKMRQLRSWGILIERDGKDYPSNAFAILTGNGGLHVATQCGVFGQTLTAENIPVRFGSR